MRFVTWNMLFPIHATLFNIVGIYMGEYIDLIDFLVVLCLGCNYVRTSSFENPGAFLLSFPFVLLKSKYLEIFLRESKERRDTDI